MSLTETHRHWLCGYALCTADSRSVVKVAMPHLRGRWSPTNAILRIFAVSFKRIPFATMGLDLFRIRLCDALKCLGRGSDSKGGPTAMIPSRRRRGWEFSEVPFSCNLEEES